MRMIICFYEIFKVADELAAAAGAKTPDQVARDLSNPVLEGLDAARREGAQQQRAQLGLPGRIHQDDVERRGRWAHRHHRGRTNVAANAELGEIALQRIKRGLVLLDEQARSRTARQRLDPERARAREEIGDREPLETADAAGQHREQSLAHAIGGRAGRVTLGRDDLATAILACDDPHQRLPPRGARGG